MDLPAKYVGKKLKVSWQETEVYIPAAKGYFKIKEITEVQVLWSLSKCSGITKKQICNPFPILGISFVGNDQAHTHIKTRSFSKY